MLGVRVGYAPDMARAEIAIFVFREKGKPVEQDAGIQEERFDRLIGASPFTHICDRAGEKDQNNFIFFCF